jgi:carbon storage regulator
MRMLSITRDLKKNSVIIGDDITVRVVAISGGQVKLAIEAPKEYKILRSELLEKQEKSA